MKQLLLTIQESVAAFFSYIRRVRYAVLALTIYIFVLHFRLFDTLVPGIDTEHLISGSETLYDSWLTIGRQGLLILKHFMGTRLFNPDFAAMLTLLLLIPVCLLVPFTCGLVCEKADGFRGESWLVFTFGAITVSHPILAEQMYFTLQSAEVVFSFLLLELCLIGSHFWSTYRNPLWLLSTILVLQIPFSTYQAFVPLFISGAVGMVFLQSLLTPKTIRRQLIYVGRLIFLFLGGFLLNQTVTRLFFSNSSYLSGQFSWDKTEIGSGFLKVLSHIYDVFTGNGTFYFNEFMFLSLALFMILVCHWSRTKKASTMIWQIFLLCAWFASPFYLSVLLGSRPVIRAQLILPFVTGGTAFLSGLLFLQWERTGPRKVLRSTAALLLVLLSLNTVYQEASVTSRLYYSDTVRKQGDLFLANSLMTDIQTFTGEKDYSGVVIFWGRREAAKNPSCIQGDIMGQSFFNWDVDVEPFSYYSSLRIVRFLNSLGASYQIPDRDLVKQLSDYMKDTPCYPAPDSIKWIGDAVVIKLSD